MARTPTCPTQLSQSVEPPRLGAKSEGVKELRVEALRTLGTGNKKCVALTRPAEGLAKKEGAKNRSERRVTKAA